MLDTWSTTVEMSFIDDLLAQHMRSLTEHSILRALEGRMKLATYLYQSCFRPPSIIHTLLDLTITYTGQSISRTPTEMAEEALRIQPRSPINGGNTVGAPFPEQYIWPVISSSDVQMASVHCAGRLRRLARSWMKLNGLPIDTPLHDGGLLANQWIIVPVGLSNSPIEVPMPIDIILAYRIEVPVYGTSSDGRETCGCVGHTFVAMYVAPTCQQIDAGIEKDIHKQNFKAAKLALAEVLKMRIDNSMNNTASFYVMTQEVTSQ